MGLDVRYQLAPSLEMYFVDKDTGLPLTNGQVYFFEDDARTIPKSVFQLSGSPPNYSYTVLPNPSILSSVGTFQDDSGNDILPYYFPFDDDGNIQLYYIEVYDQNGVLQFTREGFPNFSAEDILADNDVTNFIANGQFLVHTDVPASSANNFIPGRISQAVTNIAQGGWTFERNGGSTATDTITFFSYPSVTSPTGNPRFAVEIERTQASSDTINDLRLKFPSVNTFASDTQTYNLYFEAQSGTPSSSINNVQIIIRKFYGTSGSAADEELISSITIPDAITSFNTSLLFGTNTNKTIGPLGDDYVQIVIRFPPTSIQDAIFTDFALILNSDILTAFPTQTEAQQISQATSGYLPVPNPDGSDLYLPIQLTQIGFDFDRSVIGKIVGATNAIPGIGELICDGTTYRTDNYSSDGIPYYRLQAKLFNGTIPIYGTGSAFVTTIPSSLTAQNLIYTTNLFGSATAPADGVNPTGFTFASIHSPAVSNFGLTTYQFDTDKILAVSNLTGSVTAPTANTSGFTITDVRNISAVSTYHIFTIQTIAVSAMAAGTYFKFTALNPGIINYYVWFKKDGAGADPVPGGTGIEVDLFTGMSAQDVAIAVQNAMMGSRQNLITCLAANSIPNSSWFSFGTPNGNAYYVWYNKDGAGVDPNPPAMTQGIEIAITSGQANTVVAANTSIALNSAYFAVPDFRGMFLRGYDPTQLWDLNATTRFGVAPSVFGDALGTFEIDSFLSHNHTATTTGSVDYNVSNVYGAPVGAAILTHDGSVVTNLRSNPGIFTTTVAQNGDLETRPVNAYIYWMIKY